MERGDPVECCDGAPVRFDETQLAIRTAKVIQKNHANDFVLIPNEQRDKQFFKLGAGITIPRQGEAMTFPTFLFLQTQHTRETVTSSKTVFYNWQLLFKLILSLCSDRLPFPPAPVRPPRVPLLPQI